MSFIINIFAIFLFTFFSTATIVDESAEMSESYKVQSPLNGTINIYTDGAFEIDHSVSGTAGVNNVIGKLYVANNSAEGEWSGNASGASSICVEDSSPHEIRVEYTPNTQGFVINLYVNTDEPPDSYCF
ncbi:MAG: hypothetical protein MI975_13425 [Cytophagales bacterium]|nr:hypothetical protein [Cytophagales bacterium]